MKRKLESYSRNFVLILSVATILAVLNPATVSGQTSGTGLDGYTRILWQGTDSSIVIWKLDGNLKPVSGVSAGPYPGWIPVALTVGNDNYTRIMWRATTGALALWLVDPNLNFISGYGYGPYLGWLPESTSVDSAGYERVIWRHTLGYMAIWVLSPNQSTLIAVASYANSGYVPARPDAATARGSTMASKNSPLGRAGQTGYTLPKELTPQFQRLPGPPQAIE